MRWQLINPQGNPDNNNAAVAEVITPRPRDIGDFEVRRALPTAGRMMVGPFIFFDQMGPVLFQAGQALDVRPHPHIGLSTITWLFEGEIRHQDSLGSDVVIRPGEVNWMTAGAGIVHSERSPAAARKPGTALAGIQVWVALPLDQEECAPGFWHYDADEIPRFNEAGISIALIVGSAFGQRSPVQTASETLYAELKLEAGCELQVPEAEERGLYIYSGTVMIDGTQYSAGSLLVLQTAKPVTVQAVSACCCMLIGGAALEGPRHIYWNFVSSSLERIEQARDDWRNKRFGTVSGDDEFIPLPGT